MGEDLVSHYNVDGLKLNGPMKSQFTETHCSTRHFKAIEPSQLTSLNQTVLCGREDGLEDGLPMKATNGSCRVPLNSKDSFVALVRS